MLKNIRLHIDKNEEQQTQIERASAALIDSQLKRNLKAFQTFIPSLAEQIQSIRTDNISIFCNKHGQFNIVDYGIGRTFYGLNPESEIEEQFLNYRARAISVSMQAESDSAENEGFSHHGHSLSKAYADSGYSKRRSLPQSIETMVVLGIGLGFHILELLKHCNIENLVIYEPELQYFKCSAFCNLWDEALSLASEKNTRLFFQLGKDGRTIISDISELRQHFDFERLYLYKHYNTPTFNNIEQACAKYDWPHLERGALLFETPSTPSEFIPIWTQSLPLDRYKEPSEASQYLREKNLEAFQKYFPDVYKAFANFEPQTWLPIQGENGEINILHKRSLVPWYGDSPSQECLANFTNFSEQPNKDGLILGYKGRKLKKYLHYQFVGKTEALLDEVEKEEGALPDTIKSLILFGVGVGYQIETLLNNHHVEKLFVCEPNKDFFHASLYAIKWHEILASIDESDGRLYINIGDDGTNLFKDLLNQFYSIGPYILANTYFYQSYYNSVLVSALARLREQLQVVISMGEYFDHARFGISHTAEMINQGTPFLRRNPSQYLSFDEKEVPVFIVGNGPSLDNAIEKIKEWRDHAIVVSCGTALSAMHKYGIKPDFHAEIEQNRSTYDWCCRVNDFEYLSEISLISVNGIHPDTCSLFKDVYVAFKDGESSTIASLELLGRKNYEELQFAFPTVSNLAINLFSKLGMQQLYLFGVDLGFYDKDKHHSTLSTYYDNGKEVYDYNASNNTSIVVPGNFRKTVHTKYEFKLSKTIIEQSLASNKVSCFNCSDGAKIAGAAPLSPDLVLISTAPEHKNSALRTIKETAFSTSELSAQYQTLFDKKFSPAALEEELSVFIKRASDSFESFDDVETLIQTQKEMLFESNTRKQSLLFYLLYGTVNYANALFSKLTSTTSDLQTLEKARNEWVNTLTIIADDYLTDSNAFDVTSSCIQRRELIFVKRWIDENSPSIQADVDDENACVRTFTSINEETGESSALRSRQIYSLILHSNIDTSLNKLDALSDDAACLLGSYTEVDKKWIDRAHSRDGLLSYYIHYRPLPLSEDLLLSGQVPLVTPHRQQLLPSFFCCMNDVLLFLPKYEFVNSSTEQKAEYLTSLLNSLSWVSDYVEYTRYVAVPRQGVSVDAIVCDKVGNRGKVHKGNIKLETLLLEDIALDRLEMLLSHVN